MIDGNLSTQIQILNFIKMLLLYLYGSNFTLDVVEEHVLLLVELIPTWLSVAKVRGKSYIKMNKSKEIANVVQDIQEKIKEIENA